MTGAVFPEEHHRLGLIEPPAAGGKIPHKAEQGVFIGCFHDLHERLDAKLHRQGEEQRGVRLRGQFFH